MRLAEKTLELTICSQLGFFLGRRMVWFGLTQEQEAVAGFDACTRLGGKLLFLQFKASNKFVRGLRRFHLPHRQFIQLRWRARRRLKRSVYFVLPDIGSTAELAANPDVIGKTWLLNPLEVRALGRPMTRAGTVRRNGVHYADLTPPTVTIYSKPVEVRLHKIAEAFIDPVRVSLAKDAFPGGTKEFLDFRALLPRNSVGIVLP